MGKRIAVKLIVSREMTDRTKNGSLEDRVIRFPKAARTIIDSQQTHIEIGIGNTGGVIKLEIKQSYKSDLDKLSKMIAAKEVSDEEAKLVGFVTENTWQAVSSARSSATKKDIWVSDDITNITIGTDPEFGIYKEGQLVQACEVEELSSIGKLGHDWTPVELRPEGSTNHEDVVEEMVKLLSKESKPIKKYEWFAGAGGTLNGSIKTFGGHIHIGYPRIIPVEKKELISRSICTVLNDLIAIPLVNIDIHFGSERRKMGGYGNPTSPDAIRTDHDNRFEWRVLSGSWMCSPEAAKAVLGTTKACVEDLYMLLAEDKFDSNAVIKKVSKSEGSLFKKLKCIEPSEVNKLLMESPKEGIGKELTKKCISRLKSMGKYKEYCSDVDCFCDLISRDPASLNFSMKETWL